MLIAVAIALVLIYGQENFQRSQARSICRQHQSIRNESLPSLVLNWKTNIMVNEKIISAHPVTDSARVIILDRIAKLEKEHDVKVLFACESGSRGWGFASPDSDYDVRFIYVNKLPWYMSVTPGKDVIELPIASDLDINGWDLRKTLQLLKASNPTLLEWFRSPIVYHKELPWSDRLHLLAEENFRHVKGYFHYVSMAKKKHARTPLW